MCINRGCKTDKMTIPFDFHTHSELSFDGKDSPEEMVKAAVSLGMTAYALTDHVEAELFDAPDYRCDLTVQRAAQLLPPLKEKYRGKVDFLYGVELGQPLQNLTLAEELLKENDYDFVIGSLHAAAGYEDFYFLDYSRPENEPVQLLDRYFEELLAMAEWGKFDVLGHLTYPLRYISGKHGINVDMTRWDSLIEKIFLALIKNGCGIEINTSGLRQELGKTIPDEKYVQKFRQLGGELLTIGSDSHGTADLGKGIAEGIETAKRAGFTKITCFKKRKPTFIKI